MKPVTYHLSVQQLERLRSESERTGLTVAELIRRAVDTLYPPVSSEDIGPLRYKGYVAAMRVKPEKRGKRWIVVFEGTCHIENGTIHFVTESVEDAWAEFKLQVDRFPGVKDSLGRVLAKARKEIRER